MGAHRVTLSLDRSLIDQTRAAGDANLSRLVGRLLGEHLDSIRRQNLREELRLGYLAEAETDLKVALEFRDIDDDLAHQDDR